MKRIFRITIFLLCFIFFGQSVVVSPQIVIATDNITCSFYYGDKSYNYKLEDLGYTGNIFNLELKDLLIKVLSLGITKEDSIRYVFKNINSVIENLESQINIEPQDSLIDVTSGYPKITKEVVGIKLIKEDIYADIYDSFMNKNKINSYNIYLNTNEVLPACTKVKNQEYTHLKSEFRTYITGSRQEGRIHNIKTALEKFNGKVIMPKEEVSFNSVIGDTTAENGYKTAKIILYGKYVDDYGGGVCQAATTIYNAALEAGLKVKQVNPHSLKVGYIEGSFDAMVAGNLSDLVIENPYDYPVFVHAYATEYECGVKIFGKENEYTIVRRTEKIDFDAEEFPRVMHKTEGFLDYYKEGKLISTSKIRSDNYYKQKTEETSVDNNLLNAV